MRAARLLHHHRISLNVPSHKYFGRRSRPSGHRQLGRLWFWLEAKKYTALRLPLYLMALAPPEWLTPLAETPPAELVKAMSKGHDGPSCCCQKGPEHRQQDADAEDAGPDASCCWACIFCDGSAPANHPMLEKPVAHPGVVVVDQDQNKDLEELDQLVHEEEHVVDPEEAELLMLEEEHEGKDPRPAQCPQHPRPSPDPSLKVMVCAFSKSNALKEMSL
eukprot:s1650_g10.t1